MKCSISSSQYSKVFYYPNVVSGNIVFLTFIYTITIFAANMEAIRMANDDLDAFNNIPSSIIEHILSLVPIKDAVRTSILSRNWRYRWTKIPKLVFDLEDMVDEEELEEQLLWASETKELMMRCKRFFAIHRVLCMHRGPILDFGFSMVEPDDDTCIDVE